MNTRPTMQENVSPAWKIYGHQIHETHVFTGATIPFWMLYQYQNLRYRFISKTDWGVPLDHQNKLEMDEFDRRPETMHLLVTVFDKNTQQVRVVAGVRLIQTNHPYQLQNASYAAMTNGMALPTSSTIVEGSRWVSKVDGSDTSNTVISLLMQKMFEYCRPKGIETLIAAVPVCWEQWLNDYGIETWGHRATEVYEKHSAQYLVIRFPISAAFAQAGEAQREYLDSIKVA